MHRGNVRFGAQLYAVETGNCGAALYVGTCLDVINNYTPPVLPDPTTTTTTTTSTTTTSTTTTSTTTTPVPSKYIYIYMYM